MLSPFIYGYDILVNIWLVKHLRGSGPKQNLKIKPCINSVFPGPTKARVIGLPSQTKKKIIELFLLTNFVKEAKQSMQ